MKITPPRTSGVVMTTLLVLLSGCSHSATKTSPAPAAGEPDPSLELCLTTREFVTALEFVRDDENFRLKEPEASELALQIADGCTGAAQRFISAAKLLIRSGLNRRDATNWGLKLARDSDARAQAFSSAFKRAYLQEYLDLDLSTALKIASEVSLEFPGDLKRVREDFERLVDFCSEKSNAGVPLPNVRCGEFASSLAKKGAPWQGGIASPFFRVFEFLTSEREASLTTQDAFRTAETLVSAGPKAPENFMQAYRYAVSGDGLGLGRSEAIAFARKLSIRTAVKNEVKPAAPAVAPSHPGSGKN